MSSAQVNSVCAKGVGDLVLPVPKPSEWYYLEIDIRPKPKQRPRVLRNGMVFTPHETVLFEMQIRMAALQSDLPYWVNGAIGLACYFTLPRPKDHQELGVSWCTNQPDRDNLEKAILDAMNGVIVRDDEQICFGAQWKMHSPENETPKIRLYIFPMESAIAGVRHDHHKMLAETVAEMQRAHRALERKAEKQQSNKAIKAAEREAKRVIKKAEREAAKATKKAARAAARALKPQRARKSRKP